MGKENEGLSIDEVTAKTGVPSRTIRFYQSRGALPKPERRGRKAIYTAAHVERLELIGVLQERGLRIKAIRDLVQRIDAGEVTLEGWLGLEATLHSSWTTDSPTVYGREELLGALDTPRPGLLSDLVRLGVVERRGESYFVDSPSLVQTVARFERAGVDLVVAVGLAELATKQLTKLSDGLVRHCVRHADRGFGKSPAAADLGAAFEQARPLVQTMVQSVFGHQMECRLRELAESGKLVAVAR